MSPSAPPKKTLKRQTKSLPMGKRDLPSPAIEPPLNFPPINFSTGPDSGGGEDGVSAKSRSGQSQVRLMFELILFWS